MPRKEVVPPEQYESILRELSHEDENENNDLGSDDSEVEFINESVHDTGSELEIPDILNEDALDDVSSVSGESDFFTKTIYTSKTVKGQKVKEASEVHKWKKTLVKSKFSRTPQKNILKKILPFPINCQGVSDELTAFTKIINIGMVDINSAIHKPVH